VVESLRLLYSAIYFCLLPIVLLRLWWLGRRNPAYRARWQERLGCYAGTEKLAAPLWIHAVSVGEVAAAAPLIKALREQNHARPILLTTTTPTGCDAVERQFGQGVTHVYFPYDLEFIVRRFLARFRPCGLLLMETELWPNVIAGCRQANVPVMLINGRLSAKSARRYHWFQSLVQPMLASLTHAAMQTTADAARLYALGAMPAAVSVTGSLKFDLHVPASIYEEAAALRRHLGPSRPIWMAGSTRLGEEEKLLEIFAALKPRLPALLLVLAPRHPERFAEVNELCHRHGLQTRLRSAGMACLPATEVLVLDTMGELLRFYAACDVAFVGGSLAPLGGQNILEPAAVGVPIVTGPHLFNFLEIAEKLVIGGSLKIADDVPAIANIIASWLLDSDARDAAGRSGREIVEANRGATHKVLALLKAQGL
jgi:3-deoxy-D-manno-octulosonic-acid transferase